MDRIFTQLLRRPRFAALAAGALAATGFAPLGLWPVTLLSLIILLFLLDKTTTRRGAFALGWCFGVGHFALGLNWIAHAFSFQDKMPPQLGYLAVVLLALYLALFPGLATLAAWQLRRLVIRPGNAPERGQRVLALALASGWIVTEWLRAWLFTGFAWNPLAAVAVAAATPALWLGTYGLSGLILLAAGGLWLAMQRDWRPALAITAGLAAIWGGSGLDQAMASSVDYRVGAPITIVQPDIGQGDKWDMQQRALNFRKLAANSARAAGTGPRLLLWPEAAVPDYLEDGYPLDWYVDSAADVRARLAGVLGPDDLLLTGAVKLIPNAAGNDIIAANNSVFSLTGRARLGPRYDKAHLVPYGEYLPMRPLLSAIGISRLAPGAIDFGPGPGPRTLDLGAFGRIGVQICYEIIFSGEVVDRAHRPAAVFNPSNDAWFGAWGPPQHLAQARLRAIEEGMPVIRSTPTGISALIDASGRVVAAIPAGTAGRIDSRIPAAHAPTLFARHGNRLPVGFALLLGLLAIAIGRWPRYRRT